MTTRTYPIIYLTSPTRVSMTDHWYEYAKPDHFWMRRRFEVMRNIMDPFIRQAQSIAEIGCGTGVVQKYVEDGYGLPVVGFELNESALKQNCSRNSPIYCYNIHERKPEFQNQFDLIILFDVIEHIADEGGFLESIRFHMRAAGHLLINVPAHQLLFSGYDQAAGHLRRYNIGSLKRIAEKNGFRLVRVTYWGFPLIPLLLVRKALVKFRSSEQGVVSSGFDPGSKLLNSLLMLLSRCELLPQILVGTSLMAVLGKAK